MKLIKVDDKIKNTILQDFMNNFLTNMSELSNYKPNLELLFDKDIKKPVVQLSVKAYIKMRMLINECNKEVAWHGTVSRNDNVYTIEDIFVYPQEAASATVESDDEEYPKWCMQLPDEVINKLRFQGHSHVNMGVTPSSTDLNNWNEFLSIIPDNDFYIFCISNKRGEYTWCLYDKQNNICFENKDISWYITDNEGNNLSLWATQELKTHLKEKQYAKSTANFPVGFTEVDKSQTRINFNNTAKSTYQDFSDVEYYPELDLYISDSYHAGFIYSTMYDAYIATPKEAVKYLGKDLVRVTTTKSKGRKPKAVTKRGAK